MPSSLPCMRVSGESTVHFLHVNEVQTTPHLSQVKWCPELVNCLQTLSHPIPDKIRWKPYPRIIRSYTLWFIYLNQTIGFTLLKTLFVSDRVRRLLVSCMLLPNGLIEIFKGTVSIWGFKLGAPRTKFKAKRLR